MDMEVELCNGQSGFSFSSVTRINWRGYLRPQSQKAPGDEDAIPPTGTAAKSPRGTLEATRTKKRQFLIYTSSN